MTKLLRLAEAARVLDTSPGSLRRWVRDEGCPAIEGGRGRGKGRLIDVDAARSWRAAKEAQGRKAQLQELGRFALDFWRRGCELDEPGQRLVGIRDGHAAALLVFFVQYVARRLIAEEMPTPEIEQLEAIARQGLRNVHGLDDSVQEGERTMERDT